MFGWEFPPLQTGGLGTACQGLVRGLRGGTDAEVTFVVPRALADAQYDYVRLVSASEVPVAARAAAAAADVVINSELGLWPYANPGSGESSDLPAIAGLSGERLAFRSLYDQSILAQVTRYAQVGAALAGAEPHDLIHAHDWMTYPAGLAARAISGRPLVLHVHSLEHDRSPHGVNTQVTAIEAAGLRAADRVIAVSDYTRRKIVEHYEVPAQRIDVVHNGVDVEPMVAAPLPKRKPWDKLVLFVGRLTGQKGPEQFLHAARRVLERDPQVTFLIVGGGDMQRHLIELSAHLAIADRVLFAGFLGPADVARAFRLADIYVMPSVSEPFGIAALEAMAAGVPVIVSRTAGVAEVARHCLRVDFWDTDRLADRILALLTHRDTLGIELREQAERQVRDLNWLSAAQRVRETYGSLRHEA